MMDQSEFDANRGGLEYLPFNAHALRFATCRGVEISAMTDLMKKSRDTKQLYQKLPIHMRRRVMGHNVKRLPVRLRGIQKDLFDRAATKPKNKGRPSRKYRRRPGNLSNEYLRRQRRQVWLETHIWHAKRFKMTERWGYKIPYAPRDKAFRACYRASSAHCLIQDISYYVQYMIAGEVNFIKETFEKITNPKCSLGICAKAHISGTREGAIHLFKPNMYPFGYIGKVNYIWQPGDEAHKKVLLLVHPSIAVDVRSLFEDSLKMDYMDDQYIIPEKKQKLSLPEKGISINFLGNAFNIIRLRGPLTQAILASTLEPVHDIEDIRANEWLEKFLKDFKGDLKIMDKCFYWWNIKQAKSPAEMPSKMVAGLIVRDPRVMVPERRRKAINCNTDCEITPLLNVPDFMPVSPLWDLNILDIIKKRKLTNHQYNEYRSKTQLIPGTFISEDPLLQTVPIILIQKPGSQDPKFKRLGYGSGWDIIVPPEYAMCFWKAFTMFGGRPGGLRDNEQVSLERGKCICPPDSNAGVQEELRCASELKEKFFSRPPNKRINYIKIGIISPFQCQWKLLLSDWCNSKLDDFYVLREKQLLLEVQESMQRKTKLPKIENSDACLIPVYLKLKDGGALSKNSLICLPKPGDINHIRSLKEPVHVDENQIKRKQLRRMHMLAKRNKKKMKDKMLQDDEPKKRNKELSEYAQKMRELWVPTTITSVRHTNSRELLGYITQAAFSHTEATTCAIGYMAYNACEAFMNTQQNFLLVRNKSTRVYRKCTYKIVIN